MDTLFISLSTFSGTNWAMYAFRENAKTTDNFQAHDMIYNKHIYYMYFGVFILVCVSLSRLYFNQCCC